MGLDVQNGSLGAESEHFKVRNQKVFFFLRSCSPRVANLSLGLERPGVRYQASSRLVEVDKGLLGARDIFRG